MLSLSTIFFFSENPEALSDFYSKVLEKDPDWKESGYFGFLAGNTMFMIGPHDMVHGKNQQPERIFVNFDTDDVKGEFERVKGLGAEVIKELYQPDEAQDMRIATFADPDGNYFQLNTPWKGQ